jgi:cell wall-associated NlpC family hydrolase
VARLALLLVLFSTISALLVVGCQSSVRFSSRSSPTEPEATSDLASRHIADVEAGEARQPKHNTTDRNNQHSRKTASQSSTKPAKKQRARQSAQQSQDADAAPRPYLAYRLTPEQQITMNAAYSWLAVPYQYGGSSRSGTDCSGFTLRVYEEAGILLPRSSREQFFIGRSVRQEDLVPGDLVFFNTVGNDVSHVGLYVGKGMMIHASSTYGVITQDLSDAYYARTFVGARRIFSGVQ